MPKFTRYNGSVVPFASNATGLNRTVFGDTIQSDDINDNLNDNFKLGWEIVGVNESPTKQDFNALSYTTTYLIGYLYQQGIPEWNSLQNYYVNSYVVGSDGKIYKSLTGDATTPNVGNDPTTDTTQTNWISLDDLIGGENTNFVDVNADYIANVLDYIFADSSTAGFTITLPASPANGDVIYVNDVKGSFSTNNVTIDGNGNTVMGNVTLDLDVDNKEYKIIYNTLNSDWRVV